MSVTAIEKKRIFWEGESIEISFFLPGGILSLILVRTGGQCFFKALPSNITKRDRPSPMGRVAGLGHDTTPTTSNGVVPCTSDYNYFGTTSSTVSSNLQSQASSGGGNAPHEVNSF